jgi:metal-responsive CopG/Arc/MetJ family transcriptional regulator
MKKIITIFSILLFGLNINAQEISDEQYMNAYIVIADTSQNYIELRKKMFDINEKLKTEIDTMGRGFNREKNLICLPENDEDEIYAGDYFPRRYPSETLSLEYLIYYTNGKKPTEGTIALVTIITDNKEKADKKLAEIKKYSDKAFIVNSQIYMGCMH